MEKGRMNACERLVAATLIEIMKAKGEIALQEIDLVEDETLRGKDFALFGLSSLDWMELASRVEKLAGVELDDAVMIDPEIRSIAGWSACLYRAGALS
ncbi:phosphopantetheine-binding protein [Streptomyces sp. 769]|nr:phosphopantetheine-binding protein [Streptomyces sp. 769]AJC59856.1 hypothetical protein GZL_07304 [Streptomyces sp. 769]